MYLFRYYCLQIYGADLWIKNRGCVNILKQFAVAYHKAIKKLLQLSTHESNHYACQEAQMLTFNPYMNKIKIMTVLRLFKSPCASIAKNISFWTISSSFYAEIADIFLKEYGIENIMDNDRDAIVSRIWFIQNREGTMR